MTGTSGLFVFLAAIFLSIVLGTKTRCNLGIAGLSFAFLIGLVLMGKTAMEVVAYFPTSLFFTMMIVSFFYGYAAENQSLKVLSKWMIYLCRARLHILPLVLYLVTFVISATGAGAGATPVIMAPVAFSLAEQIGFSPVVAVLSVNLGALGGGIQAWTSSGAMFHGIAETYLGGSVADAAGWSYGFVLLFAPAVFFLLVYLWYQRNTSIMEVELSKPEPLGLKQKRTIWIIVLIMVLVIAPVSADALFDLPAAKWFSSKFDIKVLCTFGIVLNSALENGNTQKVIREYIPWTTIIMVCGMATMISMIVETGVADLMGSWLGASLPAVFVIPLIILVSGLLSFVTTGPAVIFPLFMPMFAVLSETSGISVVALTTALFAGAGATGMSPFSQGGAVALAGCKNDAVREKLWPKQVQYSLMFLGFYVLSGFTGFFGFAASLFE